MSYHGSSSSSSSQGNARQSTTSAQGQVALVNIINELRIETSEMPTAETTRRFQVSGSIGSKFAMFVTKNGTINYYDFVSNEFTLGHISANNNLEVMMVNKSFARDVVFPSGGGEFNITLVTRENTEVRGGRTVINKKILKQSSNATVTLAPFTSSTGNYATFPTETSTGSLADVNNVAFNWDITNASSDAGGFGLIPTGDFKDLNNFANLWFFTTTETVDGAVSLTDDNEGYIVKVDDLTDIGVGSIVTAVSSGGLDEQPVVRSINTTTKEIELSLPQAFADGITLTFRAYGSDAINEAIGVRFEHSFNTLSPETFLVTNLLTKSIRAGSSGTTINLNGTYGVGHNNTNTSISGVGITTASVVSVTASSSAGSFVASVSQGTLTAGTPVYFTGIVQVFNVVGSIRLLNYPSSNKTIHLDVDQFLTPGTAS